MERSRAKMTFIKEKKNIRVRSRSFPDEFDWNDFVAGRRQKRSHDWRHFRKRFHEPQIEFLDETSQHQMKLHLRQPLTDTTPRTVTKRHGAEGMKAFPGVSIPPIRIEFSRLVEVLLGHAHVVKVEGDVGAFGDEIPVQLDVRLHQSRRRQRHRIDPQRLLHAVLQERHLVDRLDGRRRFSADDGLDLRRQSTVVSRVSGELVDAPDERVGGGVDAGHEQLRDVGADLGVVEVFVEEQVGQNGAVGFRHLRRLGELEKLAFASFYDFLDELKDGVPRRKVPFGWRWCRRRP